VEIKGSVTALYESPEGTSSFKQGQYHSLAVSVATLFLDLLVCAGMWGLIAIVFNVISPPWQNFTWITSVVASLGSMLLRLPYIARSDSEINTTDRTFVYVVIFIPAVVGMSSILGLILSYANSKRLDRC
jgi:hypothetical protein